MIPFTENILYIFLKEQGIVNKTCMVKNKLTFRKRKYVACTPSPHLCSGKLGPMCETSGRKSLLISGSGPQRFHDGSFVPLQGRSYLHQGTCQASWDFFGIWTSKLKTRIFQLLKAPSYYFSS
jgi:hypothetical protein